jgi:hypothetical protein
VLTLGCKHAEPSPVRDFQIRAAKLFHPCASTPNPQFMPQNFGINCFLDVRLCFTGTKEFSNAKKAKRIGEDCGLKTKGQEKS